MSVRSVLIKGVLLLLISSVWAAFPILSTAQVPPAKAGGAPVEAEAPVILDGQTIFVIRERLHSFSAQDRAKAVSDRIAELADDHSFPLKNLRIQDKEGSTYIVADKAVLVTITDKDAKAEQKTRHELAVVRLERIGSAISAHRSMFSLRSILLGTLYALIVTAALVAILILFKRKFPVLYSLVESWRGTRIRPIKIQSLELLTADSITRFLVSMAKGLRVFTTVILCYFLVPVILGFFPWTRPYSSRLMGYLAAPFVAIAGAIISYLPSLAFLVAIAVATYYAIKVCRLFFVEIEKGRIVLPGFDAEWAEPTYKIVRFMILAFAVVVAFPYLPGSESPAFKGVSLFLGVLFSLGSSSAVANIVAGLILNYTRAFRVDDRVRIGDVTGDVIAKTLVVTRLRTIKNVTVTIPNSSVMSASVLNYTSEAGKRGLILNTSVTIGYDAPWRRVHELLLAAASTTEGILKDPKPFVLQTALNDFYVTYELNVYTDRADAMVRLYSELHANIQDKFNEGGVEIMSPHYAQLRDGNTTTIPEAYRPRDYEAPSLRVSRVDRHEGPDRKA
jgi:small-conductance mechanosensitive channel